MTKRIFDFAVAFVGVVLLAPVFAVIALAIKADSPGPVLFRHKRIGRHFRPFDVFKFRTMVRDAHRTGRPVTFGGERDPRITRVGRVLRQSKLDELPQLFNVLRGEMSLVGPRPEVEKYVSQFRRDYEKILTVSPGITDLASLEYRDESALLETVADPEQTYVTKILPDKIRLGRRYVESASLWLDVKLIASTALGVCASVSRASVWRHTAEATTRPSPADLLVKRTQLALDISILVFAFWFSYLVRFEFNLPPADRNAGLHQLPLVVLLQFVALTVTGVRMFVWRYVGLSELRSFLKAAVGPAVVMVLMRLLLTESQQVWRIPLSIIFLDTLLAFTGVLGVRVCRRTLHEREVRLIGGAMPIAKRPVLLIGAGHAGVAWAREIQDRGRTDLEIRGFVDDDLNKQRSVISGIRVVGTTEDLPLLVSELQIDHVVITIAEASRKELKRIRDICDRIPIKVRIVPSLHEILQGTVSFSRIRDVQIEDLIGREPISLEEDEVGGMLEGRTVMVTGAGGSIGSELVRQVTRFKVSRLVLVERSEFALYNIERNLRTLHPQLDAHALIADVGDEPRMRQIFEEYRPEIVIHAAAHKHVPMMEFNPVEAVKNNVIGTLTIGEIAGEFGAEAFILISTDKAVRPRSVMGASKRMAELVIQMLSTRFPTRFEAVRFGNVIGSAGSVIPLFREQIAQGGPVTVTHPDMVRYFMTIPEAAQLVLQAAVIGLSGEILMLDMGEPIKILDLAYDLISLIGLKPYDDIDIVFTGLRPGEKLFEELETDGENVARTRHPKVFIGKIAAPSVAEIENALAEMKYIVARNDEQGLRALLNEFLAEAHLDLAKVPSATRLDEATVPVLSMAAGSY
jgi:FlaA1/EpsC-like NDP-sugar epimerase/lipopolysaccharide/colanic/teichoic acid biosynthesis glycosyltransferase